MSSSDLSAFEAPFYSPSTSEFLSNGGQDLPFLSLPCHFPLHQEEQESPFSPSFFSFSPPSTFLQNLTLQTLHQSKTILPENLPSPETEFRNSSVLDEKTDEECKMVLHSSDYSHNQHLAFQSYITTESENVAKLFMQRSFSNNSFDGKQSCLVQPHANETPFIQTQALSSPDHTFFTSQMRRVCSTGDLQIIRETQTLSHCEEGSFKVGRYSAQERKDRISKYRAKRSQRNFNKTIKYTCRKTLADNRPRIRGRFAKNNETIEISNLNVPFSTRHEDDDVFWIEGLNEEPDDETVRAQQYVNSLRGYSDLQYYGF